MKKNLFTTSALLFLCCATIFAQESQPYTVRGVTKDESSNGKKIYLYRFDDNVRVDSTTIEGSTFTFKGTVDKPRFCRIDVAKQEYANLILEGGTIVVNTSTPNQTSGTPMNDEMATIQAKDDSLKTAANNKRAELIAQYKDPEELSKHFREYYSNIDSVVAAMSEELFRKYNDDALTEFLIRTRFFPRFDLDKQEAMLNSLGLWMKERQTVKKMMSQIENARKTVEGMPFLDVKGRDMEGNDVALSDYVGKGKYVLVDFWASWCSPCIGEVPNLAKLHNEYKDKGFVVLGLFVWDKEEKLKKSVKAEGITWPQIFDAKNKATDLYGVEGIPMIILFGPDGTILKRDLRGANMIQVVGEYMNRK